MTPNKALEPIPSGRLGFASMVQFVHIVVAVWLSFFR